MQGATRVARQLWALKIPLASSCALRLRKLRSCNDVAALRRQEGARDAAAAGARLRGPGGVGAARRRVAQRVAGRPGGVGRLGVGAAAGADVELIAELLAAPTTPASAAADDEPAWLSSAARSLSQHSGTLHVDAQRVTTTQPRRGRRVVVVELGRVRSASGHGGQGAPAARRGGGRRRHRRRRRRAGAAAAARRRRGAVGVRALLGLLPVLPPRVPLAPRARRVPLRPRHRRWRARVTRRELLADMALPASAGAAAAARRAVAAGSTLSGWFRSRVAAAARPTSGGATRRARGILARGRPVAVAVVDV